MSTHFYEFDLKDLVRVMAEAQGLKSGLWKLAARYQMMAATAAFPSEHGGDPTYAPSIYAGIRNLALFPADKEGPLTFDVAQLLKEPRRDLAKVKPKVAKAKLPTPAKKAPAAKKRLAVKSTRSP